LYASDVPYDLLKGGVAAIRADFPDSHAHHIVDAFLGGQIVSVCTCGDHNRPILKRLKNVDEVWVFCFRKVMNMEWRMMGRFAKPDVFVALTLHNRNDISTFKKYTKAAEDFIEEWDRTFHNAQPFRGVAARDYITGLIEDLDDPFS
jgi:hypothetical protein